MKNKILFILLPVISILAASFLFLQAETVIGVKADENSADFLFPKTGIVLGAMERISDLPEQTYYSFYPEYNLPLNIDKKIVPRPRSNGQILAIKASSSLALDMDSGTVLWNQNPQSRRPIASLTKLMTAYVFLGTDPDWEKIYQLKKEDVRIGGKSYIYPGDEIKVKDLFYLTLVGSDNTAAVALVKSTGLSEEEFIAKMNEQAKIFRLPNTVFKDISGLSEDNVSTAEEILSLARKSFFQEKIRVASLEEKYEFFTVGGRKVEVESTDYLLSVFPRNGISILGGKTGYTDEAGYCFVGEFKNKAGQRIISVVMGTNSKDDRFRETKKMVQWAYDNYEWIIYDDHD